MSKTWRLGIGTIAATVVLVALAGVAIGRDGRDTVLMVASAMLYGVETANDVNECARIFGAFLQKHDIPKTSESAPGRAPVFCTPGSRGYVFTTPPTVIIYGAIDKTRQDQYLKTLNAIRHDVGAKTLRVEFYDQENWIKWKSKQTGSYGGDRGPERLLRRETLSRAGGAGVA